MTKSYKKGSEGLGSGFKVVLNCRIFELPKPPEANEALNPEPLNQMINTFCPLQPLQSPHQLYQWPGPFPPG